MYIKLTNGVPETYSIGQLRRDNPDVSFARNPTPAALAAWGVYPLKPTDKPSYNRLTQRVAETTAVEVNGEWTQQWEVIPLNALEAEDAKWQFRAEMSAATQQRLNNFAATRDYFSIESLCTYANSTDAVYRSEGEYGISARDTTWSVLYTIFAEIDSGTRPVPTSFSDIEFDLPALVWPA